LTKERQLLSRPPKTWDDIVSLVKLVTIKSGHNVSLSGLAMGTSETTNNAAAILQALMLQNGAKMINETKTAAAFHLPSTTQTGEPYYPGTEALDFYTSFARPNRATYTWNNKMGSSLEAFMNKKATMMINFQYAQNEIKQRAPTLNFEVAALPQITGATSAVNVASYMIEAVTKTSPRPEEAWKLVKFMTDRQNVSRYQSAARRPSAYRRANEGDTAAFPLGVRTAQSVYKPEEGKFDQYFKEMIRAVVELNQPPQATVEVAANKITDLLQGK
jgi:ABC-type glycerol-3-phosphate transport system substrate-binding protein